MESQPEITEAAKGLSIVQERLNWKLAWRDDAKVAQGLYAGEAMEEMHELSDAGLLDEFFVFLEELGVMEAFEQMRLPGVKRVLVPAVQFLLLYLLKVLFGAESMNELPRVLFSDLGLMELVGFNAQQCEEGLTKRGEALRRTRKKQGPLSAQCLADNISKLREEEMELLFNQMVQLLAGRGFFKGSLLVALDGSKLLTPESYEGCGKLKQTRSVKIKGQQEAATEEYYVYGWKVLVLIEVQTRLPLAMKLVTIQEYEGKWLVPLLEQAQRNLGSAATIGSVVIDRGYLDGADLWQVHQKGLLFVIVGKSNMAVVQDAQGLAKGEGTVYLTNADVSDPFAIFDTYDWRSVIENGIFKEGKYPWHLLRFPKRTEAAVVVHCFFTVLVMALCTAFRLWQAQAASTPTPATEVLPTLPFSSAWWRRCLPLAAALT
jgi:hypothetical protein